MIFRKKHIKNENQKGKWPLNDARDSLNNKKLKKGINDNVADVKNIFQNDSDFISRKFQLCGTITAEALFISTIVDTDKINRDIIRPLQEKRQDPITDFTPLTLDKKQERRKKDFLQWLLDDVLYHCAGETAEEMQSVINALLRGKTVIFIDGAEEALLLDTYKPEKRGIEQPETERVVRGPREGFIEQIQTNIYLLRYRLPVPEFRVEPMVAGKTTKTKISVCYLDNLASKELVNEVKRRVNDICIDRILDAGYIEQLIQDNPRSPFPQIQNTERPDKAVGNLLEGRVVIFSRWLAFCINCSRYL